MTELWWLDFVATPWESFLNGNTAMPRILLIDDHDEIRSLLSTLLVEVGYDVSGASNGEEGMRLFRKNPFDLIITDVVMPEKEGLEVIAEIRREFPGTKVIAVSGGGALHNLNYLTIAERLGADKTFSKPFDMDQFLAGVRELLQPAGSA